MKSRVMFSVFIFYTAFAHSEQNDLHPKPLAQHLRPTVSITINSNPHSGCELHNEMDQQAKHASEPITHATADAQQRTNQITHDSRYTAADALNAYLTLVCWPVGRFVSWMRTSKE